MDWSTIFILLLCAAIVFLLSGYYRAEGWRRACAVHRTFGAGLLLVAAVEIWKLA
jgi:hypothetical protein